MKITIGPVRRAKVYTNFLGRDYLAVEGHKFALRDGEVAVRCVSKSTRKSLVDMLIIGVLALTVVGLLIAIPMWIALGNRTDATVSFSIDDFQFTARVDDREFRILEKYLSA